MALSLTLPQPIVNRGRFFGVAALVGAAVGLATTAVEWGLRSAVPLLIGRFTDLGEPHFMIFRPGLLLLPAAGALAGGLLVYLLAGKQHGHGTDLYCRAFHQGRGILPLRGAVTHALGAIGVISSGGSAGPEGPIAALGASIGSFLGGVFKFTAKERRLMLVSGCGAGIGAIFQCPLGGALFAVSVLYRQPDFETDAMAPACIASVVGYSVYMTFWGYGEHLLQGASQLAFTSPAELIPYLVLGILCGLAALLFRTSLRQVEKVTRRLKLPLYISACMGGLATGVLACMLPQVMDGEHAFIQNAMDGSLFAGLEWRNWWFWAAIFGAVVVFKCIATGFTIGSGAPGGVLGPSVFIGGALGAFVGAAFAGFGPEIITDDPDNLRRALIPVGMAGLLSASMRVPLASLVMVIEMTGGYGLIVPLMLVCFTSYLVGSRWGLSDEQLPSSSESPAHAGDIVVHLLESQFVGQVMDRRWPLTARQDTPLRELVARSEAGTCPEFAILDDGQIDGVISLHELGNPIDYTGLPDVVIAADIMNPAPCVVCPDLNLYEALNVMAQENRSALPVVKRGSGGAYLGMITRAAIHQAMRDRLESMRSHLLSEHRGLAAIDNEATVQQIVTGASIGSAEVIQRLIIPLQVIGKSLRQSDFRKNFGVQVIAIEYPDGSIECPPNVDIPLQTSLRLIAVTSRKPARGLGQ